MQNALHKLKEIFGWLLLFAALGAVLYWFYGYIGRRYESQAQKIVENAEKQEVTFTTSDSVLIVGDLYKARGQNPKSEAILLLHARRQTRKDWEELAANLQNAGWSILAIDLRGMGESTGKDRETLDYKKFRSENFQASLKDVEAAVLYLKEEKGLQTTTIIGAEFGAHLALWEAYYEKSISKLILVSAALNLEDIATRPLVGGLQDPQAVFFIGSEKDIPTSYGSTAKIAQELYELTSVTNKKVENVSFEAYGAGVFHRNSSFIKEIVNWLEN